MSTPSDAMKNLVEEIADNSALRARLVTSENEITHLRAENEALRQNSDSMAQTNAALVKKVETLRAKADKLRDALIKAQHSIESIQGLFVSDMSMNDRIPHHENGEQVEWVQNDAQVIKEIS